jgi:hypothetical protein
MKMTAIQPRRALMTGVFALLPLCLGVAADPSDSSSDTNTAQPAPTSAPVISAAPAVVKLPYGVEDVVKLSRAQIGEEIILNYVHGSGTIYNLGPKDIVYLRDQGVSDKVINAMLDQRKRAELAAQSQPAAPVVQNAPVAVDASGTQNPAPAAGYADPNATYAEAPLTPPASSVYVIPYSGAYSYPYYGPYGYYPYYYSGWYGPSFAFRFGGRGGFHGGHSSFGVHGGFGGHGGFSGHHR